jgi:excisionase family DNA binding protein
MKTSRKPRRRLPSPEANYSRNSTVGDPTWSPPVECLAVLTVEEAARVLHIGRNAAHAALAAGTIRSIRVGRTIRISRRELDRLLDPSTASPDEGEPHVRAV